MLFNPKGAASEIITNNEIHETVKSKVAESTHKVLESVTPHFPSFSDWLGFKDKIGDIANEMHIRALSTPDSNDDKIDFLAELYNQTTGLTHYMPNWFKEIIIYVTAVAGEWTHNSVQFLLKWIYQIISLVVLWTPEFLFENDWFSATTGKFSLISIGIVVLFAMIEGLKKILRMKHTPFMTVMKRFPLSLLVSAATPFLFTNGVHWLNKLTHIIMDISKDEIGANQVAGLLTTAGVVFEPINILMMVLFAVLFLAMCVPMTFFHAKRWFDLLLVGTLTPFAMSARLFHSTEHLFRQWLSVIKGSALKQLAYAIFISVLGLLMFATPNPTSLSGVFSKLLVMLGGIYSLAFPPSFVKNLGKQTDNTSVIKIVKEFANKKDDLVKTKDKTVEKSEDTLIKAAAVAGKVYRKFSKKR